MKNQTAEPKKMTVDEMLISFVRYLREDSERKKETVKKCIEELTKNFNSQFSWYGEEGVKNHYTLRQYESIANTMEEITIGKGTGATLDYLRSIIDAHTRHTPRFFNSTNILTNCADMWKYEVDFQIAETLSHFIEQVKNETV